MLFTRALQRRRTSRKCHPTPRKKLEVEALEIRTLLAANLWITDAYLANADGERLEGPAVGAREVFVQVEFRTLDLLDDARYVLRHTLGDVTLTGTPITWGAGRLGESSWYHRWGAWVVPSGTPTVQVSLDADNQITETDESDNARAFTFTPVTFQPAHQTSTQFVRPVAGVAYRDWTISNYVDLDATSGIRDYLGGGYSYNGHEGQDYTIAHFAAMDAGWPVYAAAGGIVTAVRDGEFDRNRCLPDCSDPSNFVQIDHGNGWTTQYYHLRRGSVAVAVGDLVHAGHVLGLIGSSGNSSGAHLHFDVLHKGLAVETYVSPAAYWADPVPYAGSQPGMLDAGVTDHRPTDAEFSERPIERSVFPAMYTGVVCFWAIVHGYDTGDSLHFVWRRPDESVYFSSTPTMANQPGRFGWWSWCAGLPVGASLGTWRVELLRNDTPLAEGRFRVEVPAGGTLPDRFQFDAAAYTVIENGSSVRVTVTRGSPLGTATVDYTTVDNTARVDRDYAAAAGTLTFGPGESRKSFMVTIPDNNQVQRDRQLRVALRNPTGGADLGAVATATVTILDPERPVLPDSPRPANLGQSGVVFAKTREAYQNIVIQAYQRFLKRLPDTPGLEGWLQAMMFQGLTEEQLEARFLGSPEYIGRNGGRGRGWIVGMYQDLLGRTPEEEEVQAWLAELSRGLPEYAIAYGFAASRERQAQRVRRNYQTFLEREPTQAEVDAWVDLFARGIAANQDIIVGFVSSPEYYGKPGKGQGNQVLWLVAAYEDVLGRAPSRTEVASWLTFLM